MMFRKETEFQETEIGEFPKEWEVKKLSDFLLFKNGKRPNIINEEGEIPVYGANGIMGYTNDYLVDCDTIIIIGRVGAAGKVHLARGKIWVSDNAIYAINRNKSKTYLNFIFYLLSYLNPGKLASKTTHPIITQKSLENLKVPLPPLDEQKRIAEILSSVDSGIETVDRAVAKLEGLKKALMRELLTGRIRVREENGKLVFYRETRFQDTEIGKIPREWRIVKLNRIAQIIMGQSPPSETYNKDGIGMPFLQGKMEFGRIYPSPVMYTSDPIKIAESNDVLISVRAPVGDVNIAPYRICIGRGLAAIRFDPNQANYMFFFYYFQSIKERLETLGKGSTFKAITKKDLEELSVVNPPLKEQKSIGKILSTVDRTIELYREERVRLDRLKRGLMDLLLTGKIRVVED
jgi:type I restriction enzyme S subunit